MAAELVGGAYEARKASVRRGAGSGVEVRVRTVRRRSWSAEDKLRIVSETLAPGALAKVVADRHGIGTGAEDKLRIVSETLAPGALAKVVADRHGIGTGLLFTWRREMLATAMSGFAPVAVVPEPAAAAAVAPAKADVVPGLLEVAFPSGTTVRISGAMDPAMLRVVLAELGGR
ncbi:transposase [Paeniroseomonas aquatica]|uniref:Transposase n=2 Tax=Paeniroseomonas aquatica TaxID=373043 RepID=A0ABT8A3H1_9PROT|nr:transposase [Paeniroseomonas aquatica]MDN3564332.1 transposase [Paeniroseomonas aquatica]